MTASQPSGTAACPDKGAMGDWQSGDQAARPQRSFLFAPGNRPLMVQLAERAKRVLAMVEVLGRVER
jgi:hypothetical protein